MAGDGSLGGNEGLTRNAASVEGGTLIVLGRRVIVDLERPIAAPISVSLGLETSSDGREDEGDFITVSASRGEIFDAKFGVDLLENELLRMGILSAHG